MLFNKTLEEAVRLITKKKTNDFNTVALKKSYENRTISHPSIGQRCYHWLLRQILRPQPGSLSRSLLRVCVDVGGVGRNGTASNKKDNQVLKVHYVTSIVVKSVASVVFHLQYLLSLPQSYKIIFYCCPWQCFACCYREGQRSPFLPMVTSSWGEQPLGAP